jgi:beta-glucanase (GH16 family)
MVESAGSLLDRRGLVKTFDDQFTDFSWDADGVIGGKPGGGTWRTHFGYSGVQDRNSRTLPSNGEQQIYVDRALRGTTNALLVLDSFRIVDGVREITAEPALDQVRPCICDYPYISGLITTCGTFSQLYGVFEVRARIPSGLGLGSCARLLSERGAWPPEIDILEILGNQTNTLVTTWHRNALAKHIWVGLQHASRIRPRTFLSTPSTGTNVGPHRHFYTGTQSTARMPGK